MHVFLFFKRFVGNFAIRLVTFESATYKPDFVASHGFSQESATYKPSFVAGIAGFLEVREQKFTGQPHHCECPAT